MPNPYDAILFVSFGGPEKKEDVIPFLENVLRGKNVPRERMLEVAEHYYHFGGASPINQQNRELIQALEKELTEHGPALPIYWGNRNWDPYLKDALEAMKNDGVKRAIAFFTSVFSCYSGCRQYRENIAAAREEIGSGAPEVDKLRMPYNHPNFIAAQIELTRAALKKVPAEQRARARILFSAHSIPLSMAENSRYELQLREAARLIVEGLGNFGWDLVFQSRSGPPHQPWLEPDIRDRISELHQTNAAEAIVITPLGFVSDHLEVMYDLDVEAVDRCTELGLPYARAQSVSTHPLFIQMIRQLIEERCSGASERPALGQYGPSHDICPVDCCLYPRPQGRPGSAAPTPTKPN
jgi:protoporphyrin/coproporphyrin ferrochelatase